MNQSTCIYQDMAARTQNSIYIGVVGPVRTGKSTFIKRFMETQVIPHIDNVYRRDRGHRRAAPERIGAHHHDGGAKIRSRRSGRGTS